MRLSVPPEPAPRDPGEGVAPEPSSATAGGHVYSFRVELRWTGNRGVGTRDYRAYGREHEIRGEAKPVLLGSSDPAFRGDRTRYSPEELLVASLSACHMLWYLHLCADRGIVVSEYRDDPTGRMETGPDGAGRFIEVTLRPAVRLAAGDAGEALALHTAAHSKCYIASSVNFPVRHEPRILPP